MKILFNEQDVINSVCVFTAERYNEVIRNLEAELLFEESRGIYATASTINGHRIYEITEQDIVDGTAIYLDKYHNFDPNTLSIELFFDQDNGVSAVIEVVQE
ncbi:DUF2653 domain-containing protein [Paenibacillus sediminis]|uniref:DUF2653 family protein n=1 Tax=Paenibacillus sediminis TaxID=664909 RepID=A0ABS4H0Q7_9BACL|nr:DUF2653 family protein [Paenibacillus sediminis]MBP1936113.1 hypothetical protein [Paenibacillus sediminis]